MYLAQEWDLAEATFRECLQIRPNDGPSRVFLERIKSFAEILPAKIGMVYGNSSRNHMAS